MNAYFYFSHWLKLYFFFTFRTSKWLKSFHCKNFTWLLTENKTNTWDNLLKKGWMGLSFCFLCKSDSESTDHLFINCVFFKQVWKTTALALKSDSELTDHLFTNCVFFKQVWKTTALALKIHTSWDKITLANCFDSWTRLEKNTDIFHPSFVGQSS